MSSNDCPKCGSLVEGDFGMTPCPHCGELLYLDLDGHIVNRQQEASASNPAKRETEISFNEDVPDLDLDISKSTKLTSILKPKTSLTKLKPNLEPQDLAQTESQIWAKENVVADWNLTSVNATQNNNEKSFTDSITIATGLEIDSQKIDIATENNLELDPIAPWSGINYAESDNTVEDKPEEKTDSIAKHKTDDKTDDLDKEVLVYKVVKAKHSIAAKPEEEIEHEAAQRLEQNYSKDFHSNIFHQNTSGVADQNEAAESAASNFEYDDSLESKTKIQQGIEESMKNLAEDEVDSFAQMLEVRTPAKTHKVEVKAPITEIEGLGGTNIDIDKISFDDFLENKKAKSGAESINEILDFGNSEDSQIKQGNIFYNIMIHGIDTSNIRSDIREALSDRRFLWDPDAVLKNIKSGTLVISKINPVKASILITRLRPLNLQIKWEQYELTN